MPIGKPPAIRYPVGMRLTHRLRLCVWLAMTLLFAQVATAAYWCPTQAQPAEAMAGIPCAEMMAQGVPLDADQPGLCQQHCQVGSTLQPADPGQGLQAPAIVPVLVFVLSTDTATSLDAVWAQHARSRERAPPLAHSIAHCCYRI